MNEIKQSFYRRIMLMSKYISHCHCSNQQFSMQPGQSRPVCGSRNCLPLSLPLRQSIPLLESFEVIRSMNSSLEGHTRLNGATQGSPLPINRVEEANGLSAATPKHDSFSEKSRDQLEHGCGLASHGDTRLNCAMPGSTITTPIYEETDGSRTNTTEVLLGACAQEEESEPSHMDTK